MTERSRRTKPFTTRLKPSEYILLCKLSHHLDLSLSQTFRRLLIERARKERLTENALSE